MNQPFRYFEDFQPGSTIEIGTCTVSEEEIVEFATRYDPQPFHIDRDAAAQSMFGGIVASGWHTCSMMMRVMVDGMLRNSSSLGSPGIEQIRWNRPVRGGDTLRVTSTVLEARPSGSKPDRGVVVTFWQAINQHGEVVATVKGMAMFGRRPHSTPA